MSGTGARLIIVIGKGGVGRSTVAAALAIRAAASGKRVLAVDAVASGGLGLALGVAQPIEVGKMVALNGPGRNVTLLELGTEAALDEYVRLTLKVPIAPRSLGPIARIFDYVANAAPAVREILTIGKIGHEVRRGPWDLVVVDGPATGHIIELVAAPESLRELVGRGPLAVETGWLSDLLADASTTSAMAVTSAEELPVTETIELLERVRLETSVAVAGIVVNRRPPPIGAEGRAEAQRLLASGGPLGELASIVVHRHLVAVEQRSRLGELSYPLLDVAEDVTDPTGAVVAALDEANWSAPG